MIQKTIRDWGGVEFTTTEGAEQQTEWNDRTEHDEDGFNSIAELGTNQKPMKVKTDLITIAAAIDLDNEKAATALNTAKITYPNVDSTKLAGIETGATADQSDVEIKTAYENNADTNAYDDTEKAQVATNKTNADASKIKTDLLTVTSAIDLDSNVPLLDAANEFTENNTFTTILSNNMYLGDNGDSEAGFWGLASGDGSLLQLVWDNTYDTFLYTSTPLAFNRNITDIDADYEKTLITKEWAEQQYGAIADVTTNNAKIGVTTEEANTIDSVTSGEPTGADQVLNLVSLTQAEYDAGTPVSTTFYIITDA